MSGSDRDYIAYRMAQADEAIQVAALALEHEHLRAAVNRLYYACFYAATALLLAEGHGSTKHRGVLTLFDRNCVLTGHLPKSMGRFLHRMFERRQKGDYGAMVVFHRDEVQQWLGEARSFVATVAEEIEERIED